MSQEDIVTLISIDWEYVIKSLLVAIPIIAVSILGYLKIKSQFKKKFGITTKRDKEHELLVKTAENLSALQEQHTSDMENFMNIHRKSVDQSILHDKRIEENLQRVTEEIRDCIVETQNQINQFAENRVHDREQSFQIQKELTDGIKSLSEGATKREQQISAVMIGNRELLGAEIDRRFEKYIELKGIPADELDEFISLHDAYKGCLGNHNRDAKFNYIIDNLPVLPVESKLKSNP